MRGLLAAALLTVATLGCDDSPLNETSGKAAGEGGAPLNEAYASDERWAGFPIAIDPTDPQGCRLSTYVRSLGGGMGEVENHYGRCWRFEGGVRFESAASEESFQFHEHGPYLSYSDENGRSITLTRLVPCPENRSQLCNPDTLPFGKGSSPGASVQPGRWEATEQPIYPPRPGAPPPPPPRPPSQYCITPEQARSPEAFVGSRGRYWSRDNFRMREGRVRGEDPSRGQLEGSFTATSYDVVFRHSNGLVINVVARRIGNC